jgi:hypothetical protein
MAHLLVAQDGPTSSGPLTLLFGEAIHMANPLPCQYVAICITFNITTFTSGETTLRGPPTHKLGVGPP